MIPMVLAVVISQPLEGPIPVPPVVDPIGPVAEAPLMDDGETSSIDLLADLVKVINDWKSIGWIAGLIALINMLINLLRWRPINDYLEEKDAKWAKPLAACILGGVIGGLSSYQTGASGLNSVIAGVLTALGSVGFHELIDKLKKRLLRKKA